MFCLCPKASVPISLLTQVQTPEGNVDPIYLSSGQLASITKNGEVITNTYDGSLPKTVTSTGTLAQTLAFAFNNDLRLTGFTYAGATNNFAYDNDGLLTSSGRFVMTRNAQNGLPTAMTGGALNLSRTFNGFGEVTTQSQTVNGTAAGSWMVTYNNNGQIATKTETVAGITANYVYTYDATGRLTQVAKDNALVEEYRYTGANPLGTRTYEMNSLRGIAGRSLSYNAEDQIVSVGSTTYQFDTDGFLSRKTDGSSITTYNYSSGGELLSTALPDGRTIAYVYDPLGRRIAKKINGVILEKYLWSGLTQLLAVYDGSDNLVMRFEYADGRVPNVMTKGGQTYYLTYDQVGSLRAVANSTGSVVKRIDYDSFGNIIADSAPTFVVPFGFAGGLHDRDIDLVHFGFRDYDPATGRWTAKDPISFAGGDVDLYGYVLNDPVNLVDPTGLQFINTGGIGNNKGPIVSPYSPNSPLGWRVGDPINRRTLGNRIPFWSTVRARFWKNEAMNNSKNYSPENIARMCEGKAPQRLNPETGRLESMELHHDPAQRDGGLFDVKPVWPSEHARIDYYRYTSQSGGGGGNMGVQLTP